MSASSPFDCGFGSGATVSEDDLRHAVVMAADNERANWVSTGSMLSEQDDSQFGHLVRYWLACKGTILPTTLSFMQGRAIDGTVGYGQLLAPAPTDPAIIDAELARVRGELLAGALDTDSPTDLDDVVETALRGAYRTRIGKDPWSAVFVDSCIRGTAIALGLEAVSGGLHVGQDELLVAHEGHRVYVRNAYDRRPGIGTNPRDGTYHAFRPLEANVQVGDIIVLDRDAKATGDVVAFDAIPTALGNGRGLHGDIVVGVTPQYAETVGGNIGSSEAVGGDPCTLSAPAQPFTVRRRRYPLIDDGTADENGKLRVAIEQLFVQEDDSGVLPVPPMTCTDGSLSDRSTGRIFTLIRPVEACL